MENSRLYLKSLARGFRLLDVVCTSPVSFGLSELARECGFNISHIQRLSHTLQELGVIDRDPKTKKFRIGPKMIALAAAVMQNIELKKIALPIMDELSNDINEVVGLGVISGNDLLLIEIILNTQQILNISLSPGEVVPVYATAMGKIILAHLPPSELDTILQNIELTSLTSNTITSVNELRKQLKQAKETGFAVAFDESSYGLSSIAMPVRDNRGLVIAALSVMVPTVRASDDLPITSFHKKLQVASNRLSYAIGYRE